VQSHPSRRELRKRLLAGLHGLPTEVVETDFDPPNPWLGYRECLSSIPEGITHLLVVQDDAITCRNLPPAVKRIAAGDNGEHPICLFLGMLPMRTKRDALQAGRDGDPYVRVHVSDWLPVVAVLWPVEKARHFMEWSDRFEPRGPRVRPERSDDAMGGRWMRSTRQTVFATIPSLIEHPDDAPSTIARNPGGRSALFWHGAHWDALSIRW
jgi:hypothetical protein